MLTAKVWVLILALQGGAYVEHPEPLSETDCKDFALAITMAIEEGAIPVFDNGEPIDFAFCHPKEREVRASLPLGTRDSSEGAAMAPLEPS